MPLLQDPSLTVEFKGSKKFCSINVINVEGGDPLEQSDDQYVGKHLNKEFVYCQKKTVKQKLEKSPAIQKKKIITRDYNKRNKIQCDDESVEGINQENIEINDVKLEDTITENTTNLNLEAIHCDICDQTFTNNLSYGLHSKEHSEEGKYSCHMCNKVLPSRYRFTLHIGLHEGNTPHKCPTCKKSFGYATEAAEHVNFHTGEKPFVCEICGKTFMYSRFLSSHRRYHHWEIVTGTPFNKYDCNICNIHYTSWAGLRRHNLSKHNEGVIQPSLCDICGKELSSKENLKFHKRIHTGYKPHVCSFCPKAFVRKELLKEHERVHTGEKPYVCKFCSKSFSQRTPKRVHERLHTGEKPYICTLCTKGFTSKGSMDNHKKVCNGTLK